MQKNIKVHFKKNQNEINMKQTIFFIWENEKCPNVTFSSVEIWKNRKINRQNLAYFFAVDT